jgi:hypothetical protein
VTSGERLVWLISPTAYGFLMISPNLHDIWAMFFLILSQDLKLVLLMLLGTLGMAIHCRAVKNSLRGTRSNLKYNTLLLKDIVNSISHEGPASFFSDAVVSL